MQVHGHEVENVLLKDNRVWDVFLRRGFPMLIAATIVTILVSSEVGPNLWVVKGPVAELIMWTYAWLLLLVSLGVKHPDGMVHKVGSALAVLTWGGRGGGFVELALERESWVLAGAVAERVLMAVSLVMWHTWAARVNAVARRVQCARV